MTNKSPLIYSDSGSSSRVQLCNDLTIKIERESVMARSRISRNGEKEVIRFKKNKSDRHLIEFDGCALQSCHESFKQNDRSFSLATLVSDDQIWKAYYHDFSPIFFKLKSKIINIISNRTKRCHLDVIFI